MPYPNAETAPGTVRPDRRRAARVQPTHLYSSVGQVVDLSLTGLRVVSRRELAGELEAAVYRRHERPVIVRARVIWAHWVGFGRYLVGMTFIQPSPCQVARIRAFLEDPEVSLRRERRGRTPSRLNMHLPLPGGPAAHE